jgi:hypothetical protein
MPFRRSRAGDLLVYAVNSATDESRRYCLDRIQSVAIPNEFLVPRYAIELRPAGAEPFCLVRIANEDVRERVG